MERIRVALLAEGPGIVVHGACYPPESYGEVMSEGKRRPDLSADWLAHQIAEELGWTDEPHPAEWHRLGPRAGPIRNQAMVDAGADVCLAFASPGSRGTWDCVRRAREAGIRVEVCRG